jgi:hypothetical protein
MWATATGQASGRTIVYRYRQNQPRTVDASAYPFALEVHWPYDANVRNGFPPNEVNEEHVKFEDAIEELAEGPFGYLMIARTGEGKKTWLFYVRSPEEWIAQLNELLAGHPVYPLEIPHWLEPQWDQWRNFAKNVSSGS